MNSVKEQRAAVLNYHRVVPDGEATEFYDVSEGTFRAQMQILVDRRVDTVHGAITLDNGLRIYITFDDGTEDHLRVGRVLDAIGLSGVFFVVSGNLNRPGKLQRDHVRELADNGHRIGSHTVTHARLPELSEQDLRAELEASKQDLEVLLGQTVDWLAPPGGHWDARVVDVATNAGYEVIRTMEWGYAALPLTGRTPALPVLPTYRMDGFTRLIEGQAPIWRYRLKSIVKRTISEDRYVRLRNSAGRLLR